MKKLNTLFIYLLFYIVSIINCPAQSFYVWDVDTSSYPEIKAKIYAYDTDYKQIINFDTSDFEVKENGVHKDVMSIDCNSHQALRPISSVITIDRSSSMCGPALDIAKNLAVAWVSAMNLSNSEYAITAYADKSLLLQDFTNNRNNLFSEVYPITCELSGDYDAAFIKSSAASITIAKKGVHSRYIILITSGDTAFFNNPHTDSIIKEARANNIRIYSVVIGNAAPYLIKQISQQTGGQWFEYVNTDNDAISVCYKILSITQGLNPCSLSWWSESHNCEQRYIPVEIKNVNVGTYYSTYYTTPYASIEYLMFDPPVMEFKYNPLATWFDTTITVTAVNADFNISNVEYDNPQFDILERYFTLKKGESKKLTLLIQAVNGDFKICRYKFISDLCPS
jgi:hypothetical protein